MNKNIINSIKIIVLGLILSGGVALAFTAPTSSYSVGCATCNTAAPIDGTINAQVKTGGLGVGGTLAVFGKSNFKDTADIINGKNLFVSGMVGIGDLMANTVPEEVLQIKQSHGQSTDYLGTMVVGAVSHLASQDFTFPYHSDLREVCVNSAGEFALCSIPTPTVAPSCTGSQVFSSPGTTTFKMPWCVTTASSVTVKVWGAGGGGGGGAGMPVGTTKGGGGGAGGYGVYTSKTIVAVQPKQIFSIVVGSGGAGGAGGSNSVDSDNGANGAAGTASSVTGTGIALLANGGQPGAGAPANGTAGHGGSSGSATGSGGTSTNVGANGHDGDPEYDQGQGSGHCSGKGGDVGATGTTIYGGGGIGGAARCDLGEGNGGTSGGYGTGGGGGAGGRPGDVTGPHSGGGAGNGGDGRVEISWQ